MITASENNVVERYGIGTEHAFKIKASAKAFQVLSSNLYTDKPTAIIREISCNAHDAQLKAGVKKPFIIHLPNTLEPWISFRDFGTGLSDEDIYNVYTTYFESTKTDSNDFIGCLGLGSKSPFSYTDNFTITSYFNGMKRVYTAFINEKGLPQVAPIGSEVTTEENGIEVHIAVQRNDINSFTSCCEKVFRYFDILPEIVGCRVNVKRQEYILQRSGWGIRNNNGYEGVKIIMGNVAYSLTGYRDETLTPLQMRVLSVPLDLFMNIGDVDVSASRETISLDKASKENIRKKIINIFNEIQQEVQTKIDKCKYVYDVKMILSSIKNGELAPVKDIISGNKFTWNGQIIENHMYELIQSASPKLFRLHKFTKKSYRSSKYVQNRTDYLEATDRNVFFYADVIKGNNARFTKWNDNPANTNKHMVIIELLGLDIEASKKEFIEVLGMNPDTVIENISTLPYDKNTYSSNGYVNPNNKVSILKYTPLGGCDNRDKWVADTIDITDGGIYVVIDRYDVVNNATASLAKYFSKYFNMLDELKITIPDIWGVKVGKSSTIVGKDGWVTLEDWFQDTIKQYIVDNKLVDKLRNVKISNVLKQKLYEDNHDNNNLRTLSDDTDLLNTLILDDPIRQKTIVEFSTDRNDDKNCDYLTEHAWSISRAMDELIPTDTIDAKVTELMDILKVDILEKYPLFKVIYSSSRRNAELVAHYVELVHKVSSMKKVD